MKFISAGILLMFLAAARGGWTKEISPTHDYCKEINDPSSGMEIILRPGDYRESCQVRRGGNQGSPLVIRGQDLTNRPRIVYEGKTGSVLEIYADNIVIRGLNFGPSRNQVDGVRIFSGDDVIIEDCVFQQMDGIAVVANHGSVKGLIVRRNRITNSASTGMYFGCHDGAACTVSQLLVESNFVSGVTARESQVGYGIQIKLNSVATLRNNVIVDTKGPGIMVYGARDLGEISLIERNFVAGSRESSGIVIGGGPVIVRNNVLVGNNEGGVGLEDYGRRGLLRKIVVTYNTVYNNQRGGILIPSEGPVEAEISRNAVAAREGTSLFPIDGGELRVVENQDCRHTSCFVDPANKDFTPVPGSPLFRVGERGHGRSSPIDDYFGATRGNFPVVGAIERPGGPIRLGIKP